MYQIPLYLKTDPNMPRPKDDEFYQLTRNGLFFCRNHAFFESDVPATHLPRWLAEHEPNCELRYPKLSVSGLEYIVGFFHRIYERHESEAIVLLLWDMVRRRYRICVPPQKATVWESSYGTRAALDVSYEVPLPLPTGCIVAASIHSHADGGAYSSWTDRDDEQYRDGVHVVCGRVNRDRPEFHIELVVDGHRFDLEFDDFFHGYEQRRTRIPKKWLKMVKCVVNRPRWFWSDNQDSRDYSNDNSYTKGTGDDTVSC